MYTIQNSLITLKLPKEGTNKPDKTWILHTAS